MQAIPRLTIRSMQKAFGGTQALRNVNLEVAPGEVHALIGENGAGKSTLMKILSGAYQPDSGEMLLNGQPYRPKDPLHARQHGIEMIYQELNLAPDLTVEENILLGSEPVTFGWIKRKERRQIAKKVLTELRHPDLPLDAPVHRCSIAEQQMIEIARALVRSPQLLIMDEPTSSLTQVDMENLFAAIERLKARGVSIIYISHFLEECKRIASRYTVLRDGESVGSGEMAGVELSEIIHLMVGRELDEIYPKIQHDLGRVLLRVEHLAGKRRPLDVSFEIRAGEIFGLAGLIGAGRTETLRSIIGLDPMTHGSVSLGNRSYARTSPKKALRHGLGLLSENRKEEGLMLNLSLSENLALPALSKYSHFGLLDQSTLHENTAEWIERLNVRAQGPSQAIGELSGGNQQKIAIGRLLHKNTEILLLDEPTRGVDVGSKAQIYHLIGELAAKGKAIIFVSSYLPELLGVCDTIGVMCRGRLVETRPVSSWNEHSIITAAIGQNC